MSEPYTPPWSRTYATDSNPRDPDFHDPWTSDPTPEPLPEPEPDVNVAPAPGPTPVPAPPPPAYVPPPAGSFASDLEAKLVTIAKNAADEALAKAQQAALNAAQVHVQPDTPIVVKTGDLAKPAARSRALRSLVIGLGMAVLWGVITAIGTAGHVDFFSKAGWLSFFVLVGGAALNSVVSYVARLRLDPGLD